MKNIIIYKLLVFMGITIITFNTNAQNVISAAADHSIPGFFNDNEEIKKSVSHIADLLTENRVTVSRLKSEKKYEPWGSAKNIKVLEDRIEFSKNEETSILFFGDIIRNYEYWQFHENVEGVRFGGFELKISGPGSNRKLVDELKFLFGEHRKLEQKSRLILFETVAAEYRALKVKPPISEEQRKYIVQANSFNEKKIYNEAIRLYEQALAVDQTSYPAAYSNLALLSAQVKNYDDAIYNMKKYLLLVPDASDARGAQDKIYEWEAEIARSR